MPTPYRLRLDPFAGQIQLATLHAPKGGIVIAGRHFPGGQFIPSSYLARATAAERARLEQRNGLFDQPDDDETAETTPDEPGELLAGVLRPRARSPDTATTNP